jgi:hypothetical protein
VALGLDLVCDKGWGKSLGLLDRGRQGWPPGRWTGEGQTQPDSLLGRLLVLPRRARVSSSSMTSGLESKALGGEEEGTDSQKGTKPNLPGPSMGAKHLT